MTTHTGPEEGGTKTTETVQLMFGTFAKQVDGEQKENGAWQHSTREEENIMGMNGLFK